MIEWGQKSKPKKKSLDQKFTPPPPQPKKKQKKKSHAEFPSLENFQKALNDIRWKIKFWKTSLVVLIRRSMWPGYAVTAQIFRLFWIAPNSLIKPSHPKKFLPKFPTLKKSWNWKFQTPKNPLIILITWNPKYPLGSCLSFKFYVSFVFNSLLFITIT